MCYDREDKVSGKQHQIRYLYITTNEEEEQGLRKCGTMGMNAYSNTHTQGHFTSIDIVKQDLGTLLSTGIR